MLALGTSQIGIGYGIANRSGLLTRETAHTILDTAWSLGIRTWDTAPSYGQSETIIGEWVKRNQVFPRIVTKIQWPAKDKPDTDVMIHSCQESLEKLCVEKLEGLLIHNFNSQLQHPHEVLESLQKVKHLGLAEHVGASIYDPEDLELALEHGHPDLIQLPLNVFDRRFLHARYRSIFTAPSTKVHIRSVFLQGLVFLPPEEAERKVTGSGRYLIALRTKAESMKLPVEEFCFGFVRTVKGVDKIVIGAESVEQLQRNFEIAQESYERFHAFTTIVEQTLGDVPGAIRDPRCWTN